VRQPVEVDVDTLSAPAREPHLNKGLLGSCKPVLVRFLEVVGIGGEFAETSPLVPSVPRDVRNKVMVVASSSISRTAYSTSCPRAYSLSASGKRRQASIEGSSKTSSATA
jgi:hypothetical protein